jgi:hypothetical protein
MPQNKLKRDRYMGGGDSVRFGVIPTGVWIYLSVRMLTEQGSSGMGPAVRMGIMLITPVLLAIIFFLSIGW